MKRPFACLSIVCLAALAAFAYEPKPADTKPADYSREPYVVEQLLTRERFENDGTGRRELTARIRVQSDAGVQRLGQLVHGYSSGNERFEIGYVRVRKPDGSVITAGPQSMQELTAPVMREAPMYSDFRQKHITVPGLRPGDTLEYQFITVVHTPLAPGQFWTEHFFANDAIVLDEQLEINIPSGRRVKLKTARGRDPKMAEANGRTVYRWAVSHLVRDDDELAKDNNKNNKTKPHSGPLSPDVQLSTFGSWEEVGRWYGALEKDRRTPTPEIRAKAAALTAGRTGDLEKIEALYDFVAQNYRYVSLSFGAGRYQPHAATDVLANQYGDCKDKHTLLAALLDAAGIRAHAVLIPSARKVDADVPSPAQFDHVITFLPKQSIWLDTTTEVAPFRLLAQALRNKQALVVQPEGGSHLAMTPLDPPMPNTSTTVATGNISELGKLVLQVKQEMRGDPELVMRTVFRRVPESEWRSVGNRMAAGYGAQVEVTDFKPSSVLATKQPFALEFTLSRPNYVDRSSKHGNVEVPAVGSMGLPAAEDDDATEPLNLGSPATVVNSLRLTFPESFTITPPLPITVARDYGEYRSDYKLEGHTLIVNRKLVLRTSALPVARMADYRAFRRSVLADLQQKIAVESVGAETASLPEGTKVEELNEAADAAYAARNWDAALVLYKRVVALDPKHANAWNHLGEVQFALGQLDAAVDLFRKAIQANPYHESAYNNLGAALRSLRKDADAIAAFKKQLEINPLDGSAHANLGALYLDERNYADALTELEKAAAIFPRNALLRVNVGRAYLNLGQSERALAAFDQAVEISPAPVVWNNIAFELSVKNVHLDRAQRYAESAVEATAAALRNLKLEGTADRAAEYASATIGSFWDTLGWIHFQRGNLEKAERYILPAWQLEQSAEVGDHLGQIYEKRGERTKAIRYYALSLVGGGRVNPDTRGRLAKLLGSDKKVDGELMNAHTELLAERTITLAKLGGESATAEFDLMLLPGAKIEGVKFVRGSDKLKPYTEVLRSAKFTQTFPDDSQLRLVRRGILACSDQPQCRFVLLPHDARLEAETRAELENASSSSSAK